MAWCSKRRGNFYRFLYYVTFWDIVYRGIKKTI